MAGTIVKPAAAKDALISRSIPSTGEALPIIGLGTWQTFDAGSDRAARTALAEVLDVFADSGARVVDSSPMYGTSETVAGELIAELDVRDKLFIATKVWTSGRDAGIRQMGDSFRKLGVERMDLMQIHNLVDVGTHTKTLLEMKSRKRIRYAGITHYASSAYAEVERLLKTGQYDFLQINYSLGEQESGQRVLPLAMDRKVAVIVNRPFGAGGLFGKVRGKPLPSWAADIGVQSWAQYFLKWIAGHPAVTCVIPATSKPKHMRDNLAAGAGALPDAAMRKRMQAYFESL
jgi:diketogulonate reductase-like aldo/keto reductase